MESCSAYKDGKCNRKCTGELKTDICCFKCRITECEYQCLAIELYYLNKDLY